MCGESKNEDFIQTAMGLTGTDELLCFSVELDGLGMDTCVEQTPISMAFLMKS